LLPNPDEPDEKHVLPEITAAVVAHGADCLPQSRWDDYNVELKDDEGFIGDRASKSAFRDILSHLRGALSKAGIDPLGDADSDALSKTKLDDIFHPR